MTRLQSLGALLGVLASACARAPVPAAPDAPASAVAVTDAGTPAGPQDGLFRLPAGIRPTAQSLSLEVDPVQPRFSGSTDIQLRVDAPLPDFWVSARELHVRGAFLQQGGERWPVTLEPDDARGAARVRSPRSLPAGEASSTSTSTPSSTPASSASTGSRAPAAGRRTPSSSRLMPGARSPASTSPPSRFPGRSSSPCPRASRRSATRRWPRRPRHRGAGGASASPPPDPFRATWSRSRWATSTSSPRRPCRPPRCAIGRCK